MQKIRQFYVIYQNIVQFDHSLWKLDYFEKSVLELMFDPVIVGIDSIPDDHLICRHMEK